MRCIMTSLPNLKKRWGRPQVQRRLRRRYIYERIFRMLGLAAIGVAGLALATLIVSVGKNAFGGFVQTSIDVDIYLNPEDLRPSSARYRHDFAERVESADMRKLLADALERQFPDIDTDSERRRALQLFSLQARRTLRDYITATPEKIGQTVRMRLLASDDVDQVVKGNIDPRVPESDRRVKDKELAWLAALRADGRISRQLSTTFFTGGDSREPEIAGIFGAIIGSVLTLLVTLLTAFPIGTLAAIYLEEFSPQNRLTAFIEVNINNLAAVPSIVFGLLGLSLFLSILELPRSSPLVGGLTLALMTLPTIIIASRASLRAVPQGLRTAAQGLGASPMQVVFHHVVPSAMPGILTGTIIGLSRGLGETAPLLMIGMVAFVVSTPNALTDAATVLPVQIFLWADSPERAFVEKTSAAILVLLGFLLAVNALAVWLRQRFEVHIPD